MFVLFRKLVRKSWMILGFCTSLAVYSAPSMAQSSSSSIDNNAIANFSGRLGVNQSSGELNIQSNALAIGDFALNRFRTQTSNVQIDANAAPQGALQATIGANAFQHAQGLVSVNQASGALNTQINLSAVGLAAGMPDVGDDALSNATSGTGAAPLTVLAPASRHLELDASAFSGASGLVQLNQAAGIGNTTANVFSLRVLSGS